MSATLYVEGPDLDVLLATIAADHGPSTRVVSVTRPRRGGVSGFFAQEIYGVCYEIDAGDDAEEDSAGDAGNDAGQPMTDEWIYLAPPAAVSSTSSFAPLTEPPPSFGPRTVPTASFAIPTLPTESFPPPAFPPPGLRLATQPPGGPRHAAPEDAGDLTETIPVTLDDLLEQADSFDGYSRQPPAATLPATTGLSTTEDGPSAAAIEFARVLATAVGAPLPPVVELPMAVNVPPPVPLPPVVEPQVAAETRFGEGSGATTPARARLGMLAALRDVGIPVPITPDSGETSLYRAVEQVIAQLPPAPSPPRQPGEVLALAGPLQRCRQVAAALAQTMHIPASESWVVDHAAPAGLDHVITGPRDAARKASRLRAGDSPAIVIVDTEAADGSSADQISWCAQVLAALEPAAVWAVVDATRKTADLRLELDGLGPVQALAVHSVTRTCSPATVWDAEIPVALLDGRPATPGAWASLLFDALRSPTGAQTAGLE